MGVQAVNAVAIVLVPLLLIGSAILALLYLRDTNYFVRPSKVELPR